MTTTYHLSSAQEITIDILESIKAAFKSKPITIIVEEDNGDFELSSEQIAILDERLLEDTSKYISDEEVIAQLTKKYGI